MAKVGFWLRGTKGKLGGASMGRGRDGSTIIREIKPPSNPKTAAQALQRMKLAPAQKFYKAFSELLSNAFESVSYGGDSRNYFMSKIMKLEGPYIQKGVERFIPAAYPMAEGSLPSVGIEPFSGGTSVITLGVTTDQTEVTNELLAQLLNVTPDYQITIAVVNNVNGLFKPSYISYEQRLTIADIPEGALGVNDEGHVTISPAAFTLDASAIVAMCVVLSTQDASGKWLRSSQEMIISEELRASIYSADAMEQAIYSYQDNSAANTINSEWYFNLGMAQSWPGKLVTSFLTISELGTPSAANVVVGIQQFDGRIKRTIFATKTTDDGLIICLEDGRIVTYPDGTIGDFKGYYIGYNFELWQDSYATQLGIYNSSSVAPKPTPTPTPTTDACYYRDAEFNGETVHVLVDAFGRMLVQDDVTDILGMAWNENGVTPDFETNGDYEAQFNAIRTAFGESDVITDITDNIVTFTDDDGNSVLLTFDREKNTFIPTVSELTNGTPNMFKRTLNVNDSDVTFVCDEDGKVCWFNNNGNFLLVVDQDEITPTVDAALMTSLVAATGGSTEITNEQSSDDNYNKYTLDDFSFVTDAHGGVTFGAITDWVDPQNLFYRVCPVSDIATPVVVNEDGEVCYVDHDGNYSVLRYNVHTGVITEDATDAVLTACETFTGGSNELELSTDASGNTVYTNGDYHIAVNNSGAIVDGRISEYDSQNVISVDGAVQIFVDEECKNYYGGQSVDNIYVRLNRNFETSKNWGSSPGNSLEIGGTYNIIALYQALHTSVEMPAEAGVYNLAKDGQQPVYRINASIIFRDE